MHDHFLGNYEIEFSITTVFGTASVRSKGDEKLCRVRIDVQLSVKSQIVGCCYEDNGA